MKKFVCTVCGYVHEGDAAPEKCPVCGAPAEKFVEQAGEMTWAAEHVVGVAKGAPEEILQGLRENFNGECTEVGMYLAMARVAHREGYPEIGEYWRRAALEEAEHAAKFAELLGEVITDSTKKNLQMRVEAENGATQGKFDLAKKTPSMTPSTRWPGTRPATARPSPACSSATSASNLKALGRKGQSDLSLLFFWDGPSLAVFRKWWYDSQRNERGKGNERAEYVVQ